MFTWASYVFLIKPSNGKKKKKKKTNNTHPQTNHFNIGALMERGIRFIGNGQAPVHLYWQDLLKMLQDGSLDASIMLSHRVDISEMDTLYRKYDKREDNIQKVFVQTRFSDPPAKGTPGLTSWK